MRSQFTSKLRLIVAGAALLMSAGAFADSSLTISARIIGSVLLTVESNGVALSGPSSTTITYTLGSINSIQAAPAVFTLTRDRGISKLVSEIKAGAVKANLINTSYALTAKLLRPLPSGVTWRINGIALSDTMAAIVMTADFGVTQALPSEILVDANASTSSLDNAIVFTVVPR